MAETVIGKDTVAWLKIDVFDLTGNQLQEGPEEGWQVLFGHNDIFPKLEQALMGKKARDTVTLTLEPEDAFGESEPELIRSVPLNLLGDNVEPGMKVEGVPGEPSDGRFYTVIGSDENHVFLDGNHPFAGWALKFVVRVLKVEKATPKISMPNEIMFSKTAITVEKAAKAINRKNNAPQILPPAIELNTLGRVMNIRLGP